MSPGFICIHEYPIGCGDRRSNWSTRQRKTLSPIQKSLVADRYGSAQAAHHMRPERPTGFAGAVARGGGRDLPTGCHLGSGLTDHSQKSTVAASASAEK